MGVTEAADEEGRVAEATTARREPAHRVENNELGDG